MSRRTYSLSLLMALALGCRSSEQSAPTSNDTSQETAPATGAAEDPAGAPPPEKKPNSAEGIAAITQGFPLYPGATQKIPTTWAPPDRFAEGKWGSSYEADTADPLEKVLDWYEKEMTARGWTAQRSFKGMISFNKKSAPGKAVTLASGPDDKVPGQTLIRVLVFDE